MRGVETMSELRISLRRLDAYLCLPEPPPPPLRTPAGASGGLGSDAAGQVGSVGVCYTKASSCCNVSARPRAGALPASGRERLCVRSAGWAAMSSLPHTTMLE